MQIIFGFFRAIAYFGLFFCAIFYAAKFGRELSKSNPSPAEFKLYILTASTIELVVLGVSAFSLIGIYAWILYDEFKKNRQNKLNHDDEKGSE